MPSTPLNLPIALLLGAALLGTAVSTNVAASASKLCGILLGAALYFAVADRCQQAPWRPRAASGLVAAGLAIALLGLGGADWSQAPVVSLAWLDDIYRRLPSLVPGLPGSGLPRATDLISPRELGGTLSLLVPLATVLAWRAPIGSRLARLGLALATAVMGATLLLTQTVSAIAGVLIALWLAALVAHLTRRRWWTAGGLVLLLAAAAGLLARVGDLAPLVRTAAATPLRPGAEHASFGVLSRLEIWTRGLQMLHDMPYTGIGLNTFPWVMDRFYSGFALGPEPHAHNLFLQTGVDLGLPGLVALLWLLAAFGLGLARTYRESSDAATGAVALGLAAGLHAHLLFGALDAVTLGAKPGMLLWAMLGLGMALPRRSEPAHHLYRSLHIAMALLLAATLVVPLAWAGPALNAGRALAHRALLAASPPPAAAPDSLIPLATGLLDAAAAADPTNSGTWYLLGSLAARSGETDRAVDALRRGMQADSRDPLRRHSPGQVLLQPDRGIDWSGLASTYAQWTARYPQRAEWYVALALALCEAQGDQRAAQATLDRGLAAGAQPPALLRAYNGAAPAMGGC